MALKFEDLEVLKAAEEVADETWGFVLKWGSFARDSVGNQMVRSADSIGANISEAYGRYHYGEKLQFFYFARGSLFETKYWYNRCKSRGLLSEEQFQHLSSKLSTIARQLNSLATTTKGQKKASKSNRKVAEESAEYIITNDEQDLFSQEEINFLQSP